MFDVPVDKDVQPTIDRVFAFDEAKHAFAHLKRRTHIGKIVIEVGD